jgi:hypothetical protein
MESGPLDRPMHPYLSLWLACRRYGRHVVLPNGNVVIEPILPMAGGYMDQDAELMLAFNMLDEIEREVTEGRERRAKALELARERLGGSAPTAPTTTSAIPQVMIS